MLFFVLTIVVAFAAPSPFALGAGAVETLEQQLGHLRSGSLGNLTDYAVLKRLGSLRLPEWEGRLSHAVQVGAHSLADLPPRALKASASLAHVRFAEPSCMQAILSVELWLGSIPPDGALACSVCSYHEDTRVFCILRIACAAACCWLQA